MGFSLYVYRLLFVGDVFVTIWLVEMKGEN